MRWRTHNEVTLRLWHSKFAWLPVRVYNTWVWLEIVKRKGTLHWTDATQDRDARRWMTWEYMMPEDYGH